MRTPLVTVILPAKDAGAYIGTTLETLTRQFDDPAALKLVAIDDGSCDDTGMLMRRYAERFPHAEVIVNARPKARERPQSGARAGRRRRVLLSRRRRLDAAGAARCWCADCMSCAATCSAPITSP